MPVMIQSMKHSLCFHNYAITQQARRQAQVSSNPKDLEETTFTINAGQVKQAPDWITTDWLYNAHVSEGNLVVLRDMTDKEKAALRKGLPSGDAPPKEAVDAGKVIIPNQAGATAGGGKGARG